MQREWWEINIYGYGKFGFYGTIEEATAEKDAKAAWEGSGGTRKRITTSHPLADRERARLRSQLKQGCKLDEREQQAIAP